MQVKPELITAAVVLMACLLLVAIAQSWRLHDEYHKRQRAEQETVDALAWSALLASDIDDLRKSLVECRLKIATSDPADDVKMIEATKALKKAGLRMKIEIAPATKESVRSVGSE